jgi:CRISPR/Cas system-associated protein endoribonuclease Cas2
MRFLSARLRQILLKDDFIAGQYSLSVKLVQEEDLVLIITYAYDRLRSASGIKSASTDVIISSNNLI